MTTRTLQLDQRTGWPVATLDDVSLEGGSVRLAVDPGAGRPLTEPTGSFGGLVAPTGVAVGPHGDVYVVDAARPGVLVFDECCGRFGPLPCFGGRGRGPGRLDEPRGATVTPAGLLVVVDGGNRRLQAVDTATGRLVGVWGPFTAGGAPAPPRVAAVAPTPAVPEPDPHLAFPPDAWDPFDVAAAPGGGLVVSDRAHGSVHFLDRDGRWLAAVDGSGPGLGPLGDPSHVAAGGAAIFVVDEATGDVRILDPDGTGAGRAAYPHELRGRLRPGPVAADAAGNLYVHFHRPPGGVIAGYTCPPGAGTRVQFAGGGCISPFAATGLAFTADGAPLVAGGGGVRVLEPCAFRTEGVVVTEPIDSGIPDCHWHRVVLQGRVPPGTSVEVETHTAATRPSPADLAALPGTEWAGGERWRDGERWDVLVASPPGRYLALRLTLRGTGDGTPELTRAAVEFPRQTSAEHLPAVWRATPESADFVERFMAVFDTISASVHATIDRLPATFDPASAPPSFLTWLASWLSLSGRLAVDTATLRRLVARIAGLYRRKGTPGAIRELVAILLGLDGAHRPAAAILEGYQVRRWAMLGVGRLGDQTTLWGRRIVDRLAVGEHSTIGEARLVDTPDPARDPFFVYAHKFTVFVPAARCRSPERRATLCRAVELFAPAHTEATVEFVEARFRVGIQSTIGVDTALGRYPDGVTLGERRLDHDAVLQNPGGGPPPYRVARHSTIGSSSL